MFTKEVSWRRWNGRRADLTEAIRIAEEEVKKRTGIPASVKVELQFTRGLSQRSRNSDALQDLHRDDLARLRDVEISVEPDREAASESSVTVAGATKPQLDRMRVHLRFWSWAPTVGSLTVTAPDRAILEGVTARMVEVLNRGRGTLPGIPHIGHLRDVLAVLAAFVGSAFGIYLGHVFGLGYASDGLHGSEWLTALAGAALFVALTYGFAYAFPGLEVVDESDEIRARRFRGWVVASFVAIPGALLAAFLYDVIRNR